MPDRKRGRKDEIDAALDGALTEDVFPHASDEAPSALGEPPEWTDPIVRTVLDEVRSDPDGGLLALARTARGFDLVPETVLAEAVAREVRRELERKGAGKARRAADHVDAGLWSTLQLVNAYLRASEAAAAARSGGADASIQAAFDVLSAFSMPERLEAPEIDLSGPFEACVKNASRIHEAQSVPRRGRFSHTALALELAREHGCLVPSGAPKAVMETLRSAARRYESSTHVDRWVRVEETVRAVLRRKSR